MQFSIVLFAFAAVVCRMSALAAPASTDVAPVDATQVDTVVPREAVAEQTSNEVEYNEEFDEEEEEEEENDEPEFATNGTSAVSDAKVTNAILDCTGIEELCDANCYAVLCLGRTTSLTKVSVAQANKNRQNAGVKSQPFKGTDAQLRKRGVSRPKSNYVSAEEYPFASTSQGGTNADLFPVTVADQQTQSKNIKAMYSKYKIGNGGSFKLSFNANTPYCNALRRNDKSVCGKKKNTKGGWGFDFGKYAYVKNAGSRTGYRAVGK